MDAAPITWRPLGRLLVDKGLLTDEELERALEHQERTGKRLGEILTERGYLSGPALSHALAEQYGVDLTLERGFGSGLRREIERRHQAKRPVLRIVRQDAEPEIVDVPDAVGDEEVSLLRDQLADRETRLAELLPRLEEQWARLVEAQSRLVERDARIAELEAREPETQAPTDGRVPELEAELAEARALLVARDARFAAVENELERLAHAEAELARREARIEELETELAARPDQASEPEPETSHLLFVPGPEGYALVDSEGPPPAAGARVERDGMPFVVTRHGRAPFPGDTRRCAYLVAVGPAAALEAPEESDSSLGSASSLYPTP